MTTMTATPTTLTQPAPGRVTQLRVSLSEWTKFRSVRSTRYALLATVVLVIGLGLGNAAATVSQWSTMTAVDRAAVSPLATSLVGVNLGVLAIGVLGVLLMTSEFATGSISSTFAAVPRRLPVLWAKAGVFSLVTLVLSVPTMLIAFLSSQAVLSASNLQISLGQTGVAQAVLGSALYLTVAGLLGLGLGGILRSTAAAVATLAGILFVVPPLVAILPPTISNAITPYLPSNAGQAIMHIGPQAHSLSPWVGFALFAGYAVAAIAGAAVLLVRRDA